MKLKFWLYIIASSFISTNNLSASPTKWHPLDSGIVYTSILHAAGIPHGTIHAFKINLNQYYFDLAFTHNNKRPLTTIKDLVKKNHGLIGINGGFFSPSLKPLGLRIKNGEQLSKLKAISWWGVFYIKNNQANIVSSKTFTSNSQIQFAMQSGPRLIINGNIPKLKSGLAERSALCITSLGETIITATENLMISTNEFASLLQQPQKQGGLGCYNAINLDGGSSTQLYANINDFQLNISSFAPVSDGILVKRK